MNDKYPQGITSADHIAHDIRMGRFPKQSTIEEFLGEAAAEPDREVLHRVMAEPTFESVETASTNAARIRNAIRGTALQKRRDRR